MSKRLTKDIASAEFTRAVSGAVRRALEARQATANPQPSSPAALSGPIIVGFAQPSRKHSSTESSPRAQETAQ